MAIRGRGFRPSFLSPFSSQMTWPSHFLSEPQFPHRSPHWVKVPACPKGSVRHLITRNVISFSSGSPKQWLSGLLQTSANKVALGLPGDGSPLSSTLLPTLKAPCKASSYRKTSRI